MKPAAVIPMNDPNGLFFPHLQVIAPMLKELFESVFVSFNASTQVAVPQMAGWLAADDFFKAIIHHNDPPIGQDFSQFYTAAV